MTYRWRASPALLLLFAAGCPTRTIYYDAGADHGAVEQGGNSGHGPGGAAGTGAAGANGSGGVAGQGAGGAAGQGSTGAAGQGIIAGTGGHTSGGTAGQGAGGTAGRGSGGTSTGGSAGAGSGGAAGSTGVGGAGGSNTCGHSCLGGACEGGQCQPVELAQYTGNPDLIDIGATSVYVSTDLGYVGKAAKDGSDLKAPQMPAFVTSAFIGAHVYEDGDRAFFVWYGSTFQLAFCSLTSCEATITPIGGPHTQYFAVDPVDHRIAWIDYSPTQLLVAPTTGSVSGAPINSGIDTGSGGSPLYYAAEGLFTPNGMTVQRLPLSGGSFRTAAYGAGPDNVTILGDNGINLYFYDGAAIRFTPLPAGDGSIGQDLIDTALSPGPGRRFAVDGQTAYWVSGRKIHTCRLSQCNASEQIIASQSAVQVEDIGIDESALYWANDTEGSLPSGPTYFSVWKLAR